MLASRDLQASDAGEPARIPHEGQRSFLTECLNANHLKQWTRGEGQLRWPLSSSLPLSLQDTEWCTSSLGKTG